METIIDKLHGYTELTPNAAILFDEVHTKGVTYAQLDEMSGKIYAWLKGQGLGREDFVLICLPRGVQPVIAMIGVWKAGAAWALVEDTYAPERIAFIRNDCGCKAEISAANWDEIMRLNPLSGHETPDAHDAAYAIYTSGTTGNPKGVLHEYGNLQRAIDSIRINGTVAFSGKDRLATLAPMNFVATVIVILCALNIHEGKNYIVSYATIKNQAALIKFFLTKRITVTFLTPSYVRKLGNTTGPYLRMLFVGSEPANQIYSKNVELINIYAASESGFAVGVFQIDRAYETCPIGKPEVETEIVLLADSAGEDEENPAPAAGPVERTLSNGMTVREAAKGETGELCFINPYVRGYINLPEETAKAFQNKLYHTGDLARWDENGNLVLLGRSGDMIKINGNRIEPAEIEAAVKNALQIDWCAARGFSDNGKSYLCAYYTADVHFDPAQLREELMRRLPYYMIPAFFMKIDTIPLKASGKLDRKALPAPDTEDFQEDYQAPENETQAALCEAMASVLKLSRVGIRDDFYELGGDSLGSIDLISLCALPGLNTAMIFRGRTPEKIAAMYEAEMRANGGESPDELNEEALKHPHALTAEQLYMIDYQLYTPLSTMYNLYSVIRMEKGFVEPEQVAEAMGAAIQNHPALLTTFGYGPDGEMVQRCSPEIFNPIIVERLTEFEFQYVKDTLVFPFRMIGSRLYRCKVFETEKAIYAFFDVHHALFDGTSLKVFLEDVGRALMGQPLEKDYYYLTLARREKEANDPFYEESRKYFESRYEGVNWTCYPRIDHETRSNDMGEMIAPLDILPPQMKAMERAYRISRNEFFIAIAGLAISIFNNEPDIKISWIYNGRENAQAMNTVGLLFRDLPVAFGFKNGDTLRAILADVHDQVQKGIEHSCYPYVDLHNQVHRAESAYLLYQQDIRDFGSMGGFDLDTIEVRQNQAASQSILDMEILDGAEGLQLMIDFAASRYKKETMEHFRDLFIRLAQSAVTHSSQSDITVSELKRKVTDKKSFFAAVKGLFRWKK